MSTNRFKNAQKAGAKALFFLHFRVGIKQALALWEKSQHAIKLFSTPFYSLAQKKSKKTRMD